MYNEIVEFVKLIRLYAFVDVLIELISIYETPLSRRFKRK